MAIILSNFNTALSPENALPPTSGIQDQYKVALDATNMPKDIASQFPMYGVLPERYSLAAGADYDTPLAGASLGNLAGDAVRSKFSGAALGALSPFKQQLVGRAGDLTDLGIRALGGSTKNKHQMLQIWQGSPPMSFNVDFVFNAQTNAEADVKLKLMALLKLCLPSEGADHGGMMTAPGPNLLNAALGRKLTLQLGTFIRMDNVIIKNVNADIQTLCGVDGIPLSMTVGVTIESAYATVTDMDIDDMFNWR